MAHKYADELQQISDFLEQGKLMINQLDAPELAAVKIRLNASFKKDQLFIHALLGNAREVAPHEEVHLQPVTHMFGEPITVNADKPVKAADLSPVDLEKKKFREEVNDWYKNFPDLDVEKIFNKATMPGGESVIRGVAKKAGYEAFDTAEEIDEAYIKGVKEAIAAKNAAQEELDTAEKKLRSGRGKKNAAQEELDAE